MSAVRNMRGMLSASLRLTPSAQQLPLVQCCRKTSTVTPIEVPSPLEEGDRKPPSILPLEVPSTLEEDSWKLLDRGLRKAKSQTLHLDEVVGKKWGTTAKSLVEELTQLCGELNKIYSKRRRMHSIVRSNSYHIRVDAGGEQPQNDKISINRDTIFVEGRELPNIWLRDNCQCSSCVHESTRQRLLDTFSIPSDIQIRSKTLKDNILSIEWSDGHKSEYTREFLGRTRGALSKAALRQGLAGFKLWDASIIKDNIPSVSYDFNKSGSGLKQLLQKIRRFGFCYVKDVPHSDPSATEELLRRISFIRETHYGGFYDFTADLASQDTAYTNIALEAHTDNTYFSDPAGLQAFHLLSHTDGEGGASLLVDGFKVAQELYERNREAYNILSTLNVYSHASGNDGISIQPYRSFPVFEHDPQYGHLTRIRWNNADRAGIDVPVHQVGVWYEAARKFDALLKKKENEYWQQLEPGTVVIFDNWRVLHGRSEFTGKRRICGGYINRDDWMSKYKMEVYGKDKVLGELATI